MLRTKVPGMNPELSFALRLQGMAKLALVTAMGALARTESRGAHYRTDFPTRALIHLDRLARNVRLLRELAGDRPLWPAIKANAYGHGVEIVARHLIALGIDTLCVAHVSEAIALQQAGTRRSWCHGRARPACSLAHPFQRMPHS